MQLSTVVTSGNRLSMDPLQAKLTEILHGADWDSDEDETFFSEIEEIRRDAISEFTYSAVQSFYLTYPDVLLPALSALNRARSLSANDATSAIVFAITPA